MKKILFVIIAILAIDLNAQENFQSEQKWSNGIIRGHEDLTRFGVEMANLAIGIEFYPTIAIGDHGFNTINPLLRGNYSSDVPNLVLCRYYQLEQAACTLQYWQQNSHLQNIHSLRNYANKQVETFDESLQAIRSLVQTNTAYALEFFYQNDLENFYFWIGHVLHTLQDSYSPAHTQRESQANNYRIKDICTY
ncbi:MAG: hypothetical protein HQK50_18905, partial [Oligoflexia bacterium]|nr:hypothetical protein [Oligoflexia bacterium]